MKPSLRRRLTSSSNHVEALIRGERPWSSRADQRAFVVRAVAELRAERLRMSSPPEELRRWFLAQISTHGPDKALRVIQNMSPETLEAFLQLERQVHNPHPSSYQVNGISRQCSEAGE